LCGDNKNPKQASIQMTAQMYVVLCNCPVAVAAELARQLVTERLAACVNILPAVRSVYVWEGAVQEDEEQTLLIKVTAEGFGALRDRIQALHPYQVPEIVALHVADVNGSYLRWVLDTIENKP
jgi:periplasmic divalent cation tolerance protein